MPSYHDLYITTDDIPRTSIFDLPFNLHVHCSRVGGWELWRMNDKAVLAGEYLPEGLRLDVDGHVIVNNLTETLPGVKCLDKQREAFEKWVISQHGKDANLSHATTNIGIVTDEYRQIRVQAMWEGWQAAQADKLEFARKVAEAVRDAVIERMIDATPSSNDVEQSIDLNAIIASVPKPEPVDEVNETRQRDSGY